jgi:crotonobetainyl-CoA:carnitine CoA-transferase CaiB-like acyl-CoA transferase
MPGPLTGVVVADFTQLVQGPFATQILADLGAEVIKVEPPKGDWLRSYALGNAYPGGESISFLAFNRGKKSIRLDLKRSDHIQVARRLIARADVVLENFRPGVMDRLGLGYESLAELNPRLVYCASSGYGQDGPYAKRPGQDLLIQALAGLPHMNGRRSDPPTPVGIGIADLVAGLHMVYGTLAALLERAASGRGQRVDVNLFDSLLVMQSQEIATFLATGDTPPRPTEIPGSPYAGAPFGLYATRDGHLAIAMNPIAKLMGLVDAPGFDDVASQNITDPEAGERVRTALSERLATRTTAEWVDHLLAHDIWCAPLQDYAALATDPQVVHNEMIVTVDHPAAGPVKIVGSPTTFSRTPTVPPSPPPMLGQDAQDVLRSLGYDDEAIDGVLP